MRLILFVVLALRAVGKYVWLVCMSIEKGGLWCRVSTEEVFKNFLVFDREGSGGTK